MNSFALYRLPFGQTVTLVRQSEGSPRQLDGCRDLNGQSGFVVAPFAVSESCPLLLISADAVSQFALDDDFGVTPSPFVVDFKSPTAEPTTDNPANRESYAHDFRMFHDELCAGRFRKLVLSRCSELSLPLGGGIDEDAVGWFRQACLRYPRLFIALVYTPQSGLWLTATPEILLEGDDRQWRTIALAGTMPLPEQPASDAEVAAAARWSAKDIEEQRLVASYIADCLHRFSADVCEYGPRTVRAAHLLHLRSDFTFTLSPRAGVGDLLQALHPTPAVCGLPKEDAFRFILTHEHSPRRYYSGFMGPLNLTSTTDNPLPTTHLYVTLRCMQLSETCCRLYAGGGLLKESSELSEWQETEAKLDTMRLLVPHD